MIENNNNKQEQKIKISKWAKASFCCAVFGWLIPFFWAFILKEILQISEDSVYNILIFGITIGLMTFALVTGIVGIVEIARRKGTVYGLQIVFISLLAVFLFLLFIFVPPYLAYLAHRG